MCDILFTPSSNEKIFHTLTGLNSLLIYYVITYFVKRIVDIFSSFKKSQPNQTKNRSLLICILKIILEWAKAVIIIICLKEQGLPPQPNILYTFITFTYYFCTENVFVELFPKILQLINLDKFEGLECLYAPVILNACNLTICLILSTCLYFKSYIRLATFIFYHAILLNYKNAKTKCWELLIKELDIIGRFRLATKDELVEWNDICAICLQTLDRARMTPCNHLFHADCLRKCLQVSNKCPYCKAVILEITSESGDNDNILWTVMKLSKITKEVPHVLKFFNWYFLLFIS